MKKDVVIAVLATFSLTAMLFMALPIESSPGIGDYDPWADTNDDGKIDMKDIGYTARMFAASGDPLKNVTIAGRASKLIKAAQGVRVAPSSDWFSDYYSIDGYSKVTVMVALWGSTSNRVTIYGASAFPGRTLFRVDEITSVAGYFLKTYDVMNQEIQIVLVNYHTDSMDATVQIYLVA